MEKKIVVLTGAGVSAESGIQTFRDSNGLWENHRVEDVATIEAYLRNPDYVHDFYNQMKPELFIKKMLKSLPRGREKYRNILEG